MAKLNQTNTEEPWRTRLREAIEASGKSQRAISLESGCGAGYLNAVFKEGKDPTVNKLLAICAAIPVSATWVLYGANVTDEDLELLEIMQASPRAREAVLTLLKQARQH
ncbi:helix-turn-helix domain-containing protein [Rhodobacter maris]|uniref:helix-turn-helix domain-containing protein n=1 Tax=Rhodobacter maris TaxID=446682 RepID=UPI000BE46347|nr:helix-turn-helix transcriptional regulator [Rhodobacter maris]